MARADTTPGWPTDGSSCLRALQAPITLKTPGALDESGIACRAIRLRFEVETDMPAEKVETLLKLTERYCAVLQTLRTSSAVAASITSV